MSIFQDITLTWKGKEYVIKGNNVLRLIAQIEDVITLQELLKFAQKGAAPVAKISSAFTLALRYAGVKVSDEEVYASCFGAQHAAKNATLTLLTMMTPPDDLILKNTEEEDAPGKAGKVASSS